MDLGLMCANIAKLWTSYWHIYLIEGVLTTLKLTVFAVVLGALLGIVVAVLKMSKSKIVRFLITVYIEVIRGTPLLLQLFLFYFVLPELLPVFDFNEFTWVAIALCINSSAYVSEIFRSGIQSIDRGQTEAARSLGLSSRQTMIRIILPQAFKNVLPAMCNEFVAITKETSLASTFYVGDLMTQYQTISGKTYMVIEPLIIIGIIYFVVTFTMSKLIAVLERRLKAGD
jgi:His/Glu/Gln/Arg/opine family amino acid ABC transporter permease subunit